MRLRSMVSVGTAASAVTTTTTATTIATTETQPSTPSSSLCQSESRVFIAHLPHRTHQSASQGCFLHLKNPKTGAKSCYVMMNETIQEIHWFKEQFSSWFIGDHVLEDGSLYMCTPVDPIFLLLPILDEARMKGTNDMGKFRALEEILYVEGYPAYINLLQMLNKLLDVVCAVKDVGNSKFYRLDDSKVMSWLCCKVKFTIEGLNGLEGYSNMLEGSKEAHAIGLLGDYLMDSPWLDLLCKHYGVDLRSLKKTVSNDIESELLRDVKPTAEKKDSKTSKGKAKAQKQSNGAGMRKVTQFFALQR